MYAFVDIVPSDWSRDEGMPLTIRGDRYVAIRWKQDDVLLTTYLLPFQTDTVVAMACLGDAWEGLRLESEDDFQAIQDVYPAIGTLIRNGLAVEITNCGMIRIRDLDTGTRRWFLITSLGNVEPDFDDPELQKQMAYAIQRLASNYNAVTTAARNPARNMTAFAKGFWRGIQAGVSDTPRIVLESTLKALFNIK